MDILKQQLTNRDKEVDQLKLQLKNLKRSRSSEVSANNRKQFSVNTNTSKSDSASTYSSDMNSSSPSSSSSADTSSTSTSNSNQEVSSETRKQRSMSFDASETLSKQVDIANDEIKLLRNKISRLEDDLLFVSQVRFLSFIFFTSYFPQIRKPLRLYSIFYKLVYLFRKLLILLQEYQCKSIN